MKYESGQIIRANGHQFSPRIPNHFAKGELGRIVNDMIMPDWYVVESIVEDREEILHVTEMEMVDSYGELFSEESDDIAYEDMVGVLGAIEEPDMVNHPSHYTKGKYEVLDFILDKTQDMRGDEGSLVGNIIKYVCRFPFKGTPVTDLEKAQFYLNKLIELVKERYK